MENEQLQVATNSVVYNRIHNWKISLNNATHALELFDYLNDELFNKAVEEKTLPHDLALFSHIIIIDMPAIYYMRIFMSGYGAQGQMISNNDPEVESIRKHMIAHVCNELNWSSEYWDQFHASIAALRNEIVAHFDATNAHFDKDNKGYGVKHVLMNPEIRAEFKKVITSMTKYISMFKVHED